MKPAVAFLVGEAVFAVAIVIVTCTRFIVWMEAHP